MGNFGCECTRPCIFKMTLYCHIVVLAPIQTNNIPSAKNRANDEFTKTGCLFYIIMTYIDNLSSEYLYLNQQSRS